MLLFFAYLFSSAFQPSGNRGGLTLCNFRPSFSSTQTCVSLFDCDLFWQPNVGLDPMSMDLNSRATAQRRHESLDKQRLKDKERERSETQASLSASRVPEPMIMTIPLNTTESKAAAETKADAAMAAPSPPSPHTQLSQRVFRDVSSILGQHGSISTHSLFAV